MRVRSMIVFGLGAAAGATATYLADPSEGPARRRGARKRALGGGRDVAGTMAGATRALAVSTAAAMVAGFRDERQPGPTGGE